MREQAGVERGRMCEGCFTRERRTRPVSLLRGQTLKTHLCPLETPSLMAL